jgi:hypothetical protein
MERLGEWFMKNDMPVYHFFIDGEWVATDEYTDVHDKYSGGTKLVPTPNVGVRHFLYLI